MLQVSSERPGAGAAAATSLWVPGMSPQPQAVGGGSARAQEIARRREEMLGMLHDLPESEYELSLTDLVEKAGAGANGSVAPPPPSERKDASTPGPGRSASGRQADHDQHQQPAAAARPERGGSARRRDGGSSFRSSSDGVLLNFYMPRSLSRSFTAPRHCRTPSVSGGWTTSVSSDCNKSERDGDTVKCWSLPWDRRWRKSRRRDPNAPPNESTIRAASAAILKAARHTASPARA